MNHKAILALYSQVVTVSDDIALDINGNPVTLNEALVNAWVDPDTYKYNRVAAYPSIAEQLDEIYHNGIDAWKVKIKAVKDANPKP
jgi:hypothetical protein